MHRIDKSGAEEPDRIDAEMLPETAVLNSDKCIAHVSWKLLHRDRLALRQTTPGDHPPARIQQGHVITGLVDEERLRTRQFRNPVGEQRAANQQEPDRANDNRRAKPGIGLLRRFRKSLSSGRQTALAPGLRAMFRASHLDEGPLKLCRCRLGWIRGNKRAAHSGGSVLQERVNFRS